MGNVHTLTAVALFLGNAGGPGRVAPAARPTELDYIVAGWRTTYARPRDRIEEWVSMYAVGTGRAAVTWHDAAAPDSWAFTAGPYPDGK